MATLHRPPGSLVDAIAFGRFEDTPPQRIIELTADGTDYLVHPEIQDPELSRAWDVFRMVLEDATRPLTRRQMIEQWPEDHPAPSKQTLWRLLDQAVTGGQVLRDGTGRRNDPHRYWLPGHESRWQNDDIYQLEEKAKADREAMRKMGIDWYGQPKE